MFSNAYELNSKFTHPVLISWRLFDGTVESGLGSFVILNDEGWILTAAHILDPLLGLQQHAQEIKKYNEEINQIEKNDKLTPKAKRKQINRLKKNPKWIVNQSFWWGADHHKINNFKIIKENDLAIGKIENFDPKFSKEYPTLKNPNNLKYGTSLCKLGFPFYDVKATFDEANNAFRFDPNIFPIPRFPIDGIFTRTLLAGKSADSKYDIKFIETSTPGLRGQSGGPIFDSEGRLWAIQSRTNHLPLGFSPKIKKGNKEIEENQFLNVGIGVHLETIIKFLDDNRISYNLSDE